MDRNGYNPSRFSTEAGECYICGRHCDTARHEVLYGYGIRPLAKKYGLWINVCPRCHDNIHARQYEYEYLKEAAERLFEAEYGSEEFFRLFGRYYLEEKDRR